MPVNSRRKGADGERDLSKELTRLFGHACRRSAQFCGKAGDADVVGLPGVHAEVKRVESLRLWDAMAQAVGDAAEGNVPVVFHRRNRSDWLAIVRLDDLPALVTKLYLSLANGDAE